MTRAQGWAARVMHEASLYDRNCFVTLTYDDVFLKSPSLVYEDFQCFMRRVRRYFRPNIVRFYMCGEYGEAKRRPHFHACLFNLDFPDRVYDSKSPSGFDLYRSALLSKLWPQGRSTIGDLTYESACYVSRYVMKKVTGSPAQEHYTHVDPDGVVSDLVPEFNRMSLKPGIGAKWLDKFGSEVAINGDVIMQGRSHPVPRYYHKRLLDNPIYDQLLADKALLASQLPADNSSARLAVKETVANAKLAFKKRDKV
jgi:hypothetical protein